MVPIIFNNIELPNNTIAGINNELIWHSSINSFRNFLIKSSDSILFKVFNFFLLLWFLLNIQAEYINKPKFNPININENAIWIYTNAFISFESFCDFSFSDFFSFSEFLFNSIFSVSFGLLLDWFIFSMLELLLSALLFVFLEASSRKIK